MSLQDLVIVTGMSGSGKGSVLDAFEDLGFFCIDNLPVSLIAKFIEGFHVSGGEVERAALGIDIRAGEKLRDLEKMLQDLRKSGFHLFVLFLEARDNVLLRRFSETRRPHPLAVGLALREAIRLERNSLSALRELADVTVDTSEFSIHQVKMFVTERFQRHSRKTRLSVHLLSFGYKYGIPLEADLLFDVRFLPNPFFVPGLRRLTGKSKAVAKYLRSCQETVEYLRRLQEFIVYLVPFYVREGKSYLTIGIGCTGGRHRSVFMVEELSKLLKPEGASIHTRHRDETRR
jgi:UPF0042 nucleotide-binding protein